MQATPRGLLRITAAVDFTERCLSTIVGDFATKHPDICVEMNASDGLADFVEDGYDLAIRFGPLTKFTHRQAFVQHGNVPVRCT